MKTKIEEYEDYINNAINFRRKVFDRIISKDPGQICFKVALSDVKNVVIINSASRSGSSLLYAILKKIPQFYSLSGESVPFYKLNGLSSDSFVSDEIPERFKEIDAYTFGMSRDFLSDFSIASRENDIFRDDRLLDQYIDDLALRFVLQWPQVHFSYDAFKSIASQAFDTHKKTRQKFCKEEFYLELLWLLSREYKAINPYYYDLPVEMIAEKFPDLKIPTAPPNTFLMIEEPPFILLSPNRKADRSDLTDKTLLLKSSVDCYRMHFIETLMPNANIKIIYLVRNPVASINGLYDGWMYRGFFSHNLKTLFDKNKNGLGLETLKISGYSDKYEWGKWWWNYDLPCGWQDYAHSKLEEVCGFQWYSANMAIREYLNHSQKQYCLVRYENIVRSLKSRKEEIGKIIDFIGIGDGVKKQLELDNLSIVQATEAPQPYRWKKRRDILLPVINNSKINEMAALLGYNKKNIEEWF